MKTTMVIAIAALIMSPGVPAIVASAPSAPHAYPVHDAFSGAGMVMIGSTETEVLSLFGQPSYRLSDGAWAYASKFRAARTPTGDDHGCSILVITLSHNRVTDMKLVNDSALRVIATCSRAGMRVRYSVQSEPMFATASGPNGTTAALR